MSQEPPNKSGYRDKADAQPVAKGLPFSRPVLIRVGIAVAAVLLILGVILSFALSRKPDKLVIYGNVDIREVNLGFRVPGRIQTVLKDEGDRVTTGELIASLDKAPYQHLVSERTADVAIKTASLKNAESTLHRDETMVNGGGVSKQVYDNDVSARDQAAASLDLAKAQLASAQTNLDDAEIHSPTDGVILTRAQEPGAIVQPGNTILTVSLDKPIWVRAYIPETELGHVNPGKEVEVFTDTQPNRAYHGKVGYVSPEAEFTPKSVETTQLRTSLVYRLRIVIDDADPMLRQGMPCTVKIRLR